MSGTHPLDVLAAILEADVAAILEALAVDGDALQQDMDQASVAAIAKAIKAATASLSDDSLEVKTLKEIASVGVLKQPGVPTIDCVRSEPAAEYHIRIAKHAMAEREKKKESHVTLRRTHVGIIGTTRREPMPITLGDVARDKITKFQGTVVYRAEWLHGCVRLGIQSDALKDGKPIDVIHFDEPQLEVVESTPIQRPPQSGGPRRDPGKRVDAVR